MRVRIRSLKVLLIVGLQLTCWIGCKPDSTESITSQNLTINTIARASEELPLAIAASSEHFSGYYCRNGDLMVGHTSGATGHSVAVLLEEVNQYQLSFYCRNRNFPNHVPQTVAAQQQYSFLQLRSWRDAIVQGGYLGTGSGRSIGIDYENNRIVLGVDFGDANSQVNWIAGTWVVNSFNEIYRAL